MFAMVAGPFMALIPATAHATAKPPATITVSTVTDQNGSHGAPFSFSCPANPQTGLITISGSGSGDAPPGLIEQYKVAIDWGDGSPVVLGLGSFTPNSGQGAFTFTFTGSHTYSSYGAKSVVVTLYHQNLSGNDNPAQTTLTLAPCEPSAPQAPSVATDPATGVSVTDAVMHGTNGPVAASNSSYWVSTSTINTSVPVMPPGVYSTPTQGSVAAGGALASVPLSTVATAGIPGNLPGGIMPNTTYYYVAWVNVDGTWYPGDVETVTTLPDPSIPPVCDPGADPTTFDPFTLGNVNGQFGWMSTGAFDQEIVDNTYGYPTFGCKSLRLSNAVTSGSFGDQTFSYSVPNEAGETTAENGGMSGGVRKNRFVAEFDIASTKPNAYQPDLRITVSPDRGDGARMSFLRFEDTTGGIDVTFYDVQSTGDPANFVSTVIATDLSRSVPHRIKFVMDFVEGPASAAAANDVVKIYIDGTLVHTGTSWENYFRFDNESNPSLVNTSRTVDSLLFRISGTAAPANDEEGFLIDNMSLASSNSVEEVATANATVCKYADTRPEPTPLPDWNVFLQGASVGESPLVVPTNTSAGISTGSILSSGTSYLAKAFGTWTNQGGINKVDAEYSSTDNFAANVMDGYTGYGTDILELQINQTFDPNSNWGPYNSLHQYAQSFVASGTSANFRIFDGEAGVQNEGWFGDNNGTLTVNLYKGFSGITGKNGCVTFTNVPLGTYTIGETPQDGWEDVTEGHTVVVTKNSENNVFNLYNHNEDFGNDSCTLVSDMTTLEGGTWTYENEGPLHTSWTAVVDAMSYWIWGDAAVDDPTQEETQTFTKTFWLESLPAVGATLTIAADNSYMVELNGTWSSTDGNEDNYTNAGKDIITIPASEFELGANTLVFTVTNFAQGGGTQATNPAGLNYKLTIPGTECQEEPFDQKLVQVHISKYLLNEDDEIEPATEGDSAFPMVSTWNALNIGAGSGGYSLNAGNGFEASTSYMTKNADYTTAEVTDGSVVVPAASKSCPAGKYRLVGYKTGDTLIEAENDAIDDDAPAFTSLDADKYVIVVNEDCDELDTPPTPQVKVHIYKYLSTEEGLVQVANGADIDPFDMVSTWKAANLSGGATSTGSYVLGNYHGGAALKYAADTSPMDAGANYTTYEVTGENGIVPIGGTCVEDAYRLVGYKTGATPEAAALSPLLTDAPFLADLQSDQTILVINEDCDTVDSEPPVIGTESFSNGGGGSNHKNGEVLGASTGSCDALLTTYLSQGSANSSEEVVKLQGFLNENLGGTLPVTGIFGSLTDAAVRQFQKKYWEDVLEPWFAVPGSGITSKDTPTGYVYKTTKWKINDLYCPGSEAFPQVP